MTQIQFFSHETDPGFILVCEDEGIEITEENKKHLFERGFGKNIGSLSLNPV